MENKEPKLFIEIIYNNQKLNIESENEFLSLEQIKNQTLNNFNINKLLEKYLSFSYKDEDGDINIIQTNEDFFQSIKEINPNIFYTKIKLDILQYTNEQLVENKKEPDIINEKNNKNNFEELLKEKEKKIREYEDIIKKLKIKDLKEKKNENENIINNIETNINNDINNKLNNCQNMLNKINDIVNILYNDKNIILKNISKIKEEIINDIKKELQEIKINKNTNTNINNITEGQDIININKDIIKKLEDIQFNLSEIKQKTNFNIINENSKEEIKDDERNIHNKEKIYQNDNIRFNIIENHKIEIYIPSINKDKIYKCINCHKIYEPKKEQFRDDKKEEQIQYQNQNQNKNNNILKESIGDNNNIDNNNEVINTNNIYDNNLNNYEEEIKNFNSNEIELFNILNNFFYIDLDKNKIINVLYKEKDLNILKNCLIKILENDKNIDIEKIKNVYIHLNIENDMEKVVGYNQKYLFQKIDKLNNLISEIIKGNY